MKRYFKGLYCSPNKKTANRVGSIIHYLPFIISTYILNSMIGEVNTVSAYFRLGQKYQTLLKYYQCNEFGYRYIEISCKVHNDYGIYFIKLS